MGGVVFLVLIAAPYWRRLEEEGWVPGEGGGRQVMMDGEEAVTVRRLLAMWYLALHNPHRGGQTTLYPPPPPRPCSLSRTSRGSGRRRKAGQGKPLAQGCYRPG